MHDTLTPVTWPTESQVTLYRVAWDSDYRDVVRFEDEAERRAYFDRLEYDFIHLDKMTYCKPGQPVKINIPYSSAYKYNYLVVENPYLPVPGEAEPRRFYYFIDSVQYGTPNTTILNLSLDVFQTYLFDFDLGYCFIERGHLPVKLFEDFGEFDWANARRYLTVPEGLDLGNEYMVADVDYRDLTKRDIDPERYPEEVTVLDMIESGTIKPWVIIIMSTTRLDAEPGNETAPKLETAQGNYVDGLNGGAAIYMIQPSDISRAFKLLSNKPWVSSGIINVTAFPAALINASKVLELYGMETQYEYERHWLLNAPDDVAIVTDFNSESDRVFSRIAGGYESVESWMRECLKHSVGDAAAKWSKLLTYPFATIEISPRCGQPLVLKPELLNTRKLDMNIISCCSPAHMRAALYPRFYGARDAESQKLFDVTTLHTTYRVEDGSSAAPDLDSPSANDRGFMEKCAIWFDNFPKFSLVNDSYIMYLASGANSRRWSYESAGWGRDKTTASANLSNMQTLQNIELARQNQMMSNLFNIGSSTAQGAISGAVAGPVGAGVGAASSLASSAVNAAFDTMQNERSWALQESQSEANLAISMWAAQGDYQQSIAAINAATQDAAITQPSAIGADGGNGFALANAMMGFSVQVKMPKPEALAIIANYFGRYGYAFHEFTKPPANLHCMKHFTYWKMQDVYLECAEADEGVKQALRGIFQRGVTVWHDPDEIGLINPIDNNQTI